MSIIAQPVDTTNFAHVNSAPRLASSSTPGVLANRPYATQPRAFLDVTLPNNTEAPTLDVESQPITLANTLTFSEVDPDLATVASVLQDMPLFGVHDRLLQAVHASGQTWQMRMESQPVFRADQLNVYGTRGKTNPYGEAPASESEPAASPWGSWGRKSSPTQNNLARSADLSYGSPVSVTRPTANAVTAARVQAAEARQAARTNYQTTTLYQPSSQSAYATSRTNPATSAAQGSSTGATTSSSAA